MRIIVDGVSLAAKLRSEKSGCWLLCRYSKRWCNRNTCSMIARRLQESGCPRLLLEVMWKISQLYANSYRLKDVGACPALSCFSWRLGL
ncbi:hypothetical protein BT93_L0824 [Corymbia citriodora subsp. variegata]|uniref:Uncharacterized protein n=1 Tax=Corymbia citriodora subsp. variegata TaxID=360336 RepID=A0A8T0CP12_CORYI|nr:hypothetical protein BT93_L0824 [Corymbia citriodora subsp. variegata]